MGLLCISWNHTNTSLEVRENLHISEDEICRMGRAIVNESTLSECVLLCTCNRTELYADSGDSMAVANAIAVLQTMNSDSAFLSEEAQVFRGTAAVRHLFRLSAGLESMVLGENQILGQLKTAYRLACKADTNGFFTNECFHRAFRIGKRIRNETRLCAGSISAGSLAVEQAQRILGGLSDRAILVIGAGEISNILLRSLTRHQPRELTLMNRRSGRGENLADKYNVGFAPLSDLAQELKRHDLIFSATASPGYVITPALLPHSKVTTSVTMFDLALPRDIDPALAVIDGIQLYNLDALMPELSATMESRKNEIPVVSKLVNAEVSSYEIWRQELAAVPSIRRLLEITESVHAAEMQKLGSELSDDERARLQHISKRVTQHLMRDIAEELKGTARRAVDVHESRDYSVIVRDID